MNKRTIRSFAFGIFFTVSAIGTFYYFINPEVTKSSPVLTVEEAKKILEEQNLHILTKTEYEQLKAQENIVNEITEKESSQIDQPEKEEQVDTPPIKTYQLKINSGMSISRIADILYQEEILTDPKEFEDYLINNDYHTKIQVGSFTLTNSMSFKEMAILITN